MSQFFHIHPHNPQQRLVKHTVEILNKGGVIAYPTDSGYALGCHIGDKAALDRICSIRQVDKKHNFTLVCRDMSEISLYAMVNNSTFRLIKSLTPGPYTFILMATREVPRRLQNSKRKTIGVRIPDNPITQAILEELQGPLMSSTLIMPGDELPLTDPYEMRSLLEHQLDLIIDGGFCGFEATTVIDLTEDVPEVLRKGLGPTDIFEEGQY
jgi:tRNA threonylcarbamoyl adenosine modification protein (Sua5/YciO/YrdC/YwlC family)